MSIEPEASNASEVVHNQLSRIETYAGEITNQHNVVNVDEGSNLSSNFINHVAEDTIPKVSCLMRNFLILYPCG